jgi:hypothetical protein
MAGASDRNARRGADLWLNFVALGTRPFIASAMVTSTFAYTFSTPTLKPHFVSAKRTHPAYPLIPAAEIPSMNRF